MLDNLLVEAVPEFLRCHIIEDANESKPLSANR